MEEMNSLKFYRSFFEAINDLEDEDRLALYDAIMRYQFLGEEPNFKNKYLKAIWITLVPNIDSANKSMLDGLKGGRPKRENNPPLENKKPPFFENENPPLESSKTEEEVEVDVEEEVEVDADVEDKETAVAFYIKNINPVASQFELEQIQDYEKELPCDLIIYAMQKSIEQRKTSLSYIKGILKDWRTKGIVCLKQAQEESEKRKRPQVETSNKYKSEDDIDLDDGRFYANF